MAIIDGDIIRMQMRIVRSGNAIERAQSQRLRQLLATLAAAYAVDDASLATIVASATSEWAAGMAASIRSEMDAIWLREYAAAARVSVRAEQVGATPVRGAPRGPAWPRTIDGLTLDEWTSRAAAQARDTTLQVIRRGRVSGRTPGAIQRGVRLVVGARARRTVTAISRMTATHAATHAHVGVWRDSGARVVVWTSILDGNTSPICRALSGQRWAPDNPNLRVPPAHPGCRSVLAPVYGTGAPPVSYGGWLREQSAARQDRILGPSRGKMFREGQSLRDMVRLDDGQLRRLTPRQRVTPSR